MDWNRDREKRNVRPQGYTAYAVFLTGLTCALVAGGMVVPTHQAQADPHAVFYTAIGQQQLFYNVLAALNQADYVEPKADQEFGRERLVRARAGVPVTPPFAAEPEPVITSTETPLSALLSRIITLEGNDLYTDYLQRRILADRLRIQGSSKLIEATCEKALGRPECQEKPQGYSTSELKDARDYSFVTDPLEWSARPYVYGVLPALLSGTPEAEELRAVANKQDAYEYPDVKPFGYSHDVHLMRDGLTKTQNLGPVAGNAVMNNIVAVANQPFLFSGYWTREDTLPYADLRLVSGRYFSAPFPSAQAELRQAMINNAAPGLMMRIAAAQADHVVAQQHYQEAVGSKTDVKPISRQKALEESIPAERRPNSTGEVSIELSNPTGSRYTQLQSLSDSLPESDYSQDAPSTSLNRQEGAGDTTSGSAGTSATVQGAAAVRGISTADGEGEVAGIQLRSLEPISPRLNQRPAHTQGSYADLVRILLLRPDLVTKAGVDVTYGFSGSGLSFP